MSAKTRKASRAARKAQTANGNAPATRGRLRLPRWAIGLIIIAVVAGAAFVAFDLLLPGRIPPQLVGEWRVLGGPMSGMTMEFRRDGTMIGRATVDGKDGLIEGTADVTDKTLRTTTTNPYTRRAETGTQTIVTLTEAEFVTEDSQGTRITMKRVR
jgi:uncharacterized protein (TIGR03066 family)